jgi:AcrR family transcriptional regulator
MPSNRRTPLQPRSRERVRVILDCAADLISENGVESLTTGEVAKRAGISVGTLYQYFADREAIIATLVDTHIALVNARLMENLAAVKVLNVRTLVEVTMNTHAEFYRSNPSFVKMWVHGRLSSAVVNGQRIRNLEMAKWLRSIVDKFGLVREDSAELGGWFAVEIGDRVLEIAFRHDPQGDEEMILEGIEMLVGYLDRFATDAGREGVPLAMLPAMDAAGDQS